MSSISDSAFIALLVFITAAVNYSCICTFRLPLNRVCLNPFNSLAKAKTPFALISRCLISSYPGVHCLLNSQPRQAPFADPINDTLGGFSVGKSFHWHPKRAQEQILLFK
jgi:hypothetical protein